MRVMILIANYGMYGTSRMHQERGYPGWVVSCYRHLRVDPALISPTLRGPWRGI